MLTSAPLNIKDPARLDGCPLRLFESCASGPPFRSHYVALRAYYVQCAHQDAASCNTTHSVEERICRWLLMIHDRTGTESLRSRTNPLGSVGIRRPTVTLYARTLKEAGFLAYHRGVVKVLNRRGLERISCECYEASRTAYDSIVRNGRE